MRSIFILFAFLFCTAFGQEPAKERPILTLFGATGDLAKRKLFPALVHLEKRGVLADDFLCIAIGRGIEERFWKEAPQFVAKEDRPYWDSLSKKMIFVAGNFEGNAIYGKLEEYKGDRLFYLATPPSYFSSVLEKLHAHRLLERNERVIIEKPFGSDLASARELHQQISQYLPEERTYRIDHYLGKPGARHMFDFRFANPHFEKLWDHHSVDSVTITLSEDIGIGTRSSFWEQTGLLRDIVQNHAMQLLSLFAMEKPQEFTAEEIQKEKRKLLKSARIEKMVRGQYEEGIVNGEKVPGYRQEKGVDPHSEVETFAALQLFIDNERWAGVPFTIEAGKRLSEKNTEVTIQFKSSHQITFQIQSSGEYEALLLEALQGQRTQFVSYEEIDAAWELLEPALKERKLFTYPAGSSAKKLTQTMLS